MVTTPHSFFFQSTLKGTVGFEQHIDKCLDLSAYLYNKIKNREGYEMVFNGEVRPLFPQTANIANNQIYPVLSYRMNINWFIRYWRRSAAATKENCLYYSYLGFSALQTTCLSFVINDYNNIFNILSWFQDWLDHFALLTSWQEKMKLQKALFLSVLITNVVPIFSYQPQHTNVCFWYFPPSLRGLPDGKERRERLHKVMTHQSAI